MQPRIPLAGSQASDLVSMKRAGEAAVGAQRKRQLRESAPDATRILLVDDDHSVRESLHDLLVAEGYCVIPAENGHQAVDLAGRSPVDLVLLDLNMPVQNGWDTFEQLTREHPVLPIIIITARANQVFTAVSAGAGALLEKPMDILALLHAIKKLLAETTEQRLARLVGKSQQFLYRPAIANPGKQS